MNINSKSHIIMSLSIRRRIDDDAMETRVDA